MSQHDMNLADQAGASFRSDLNNAIVALVGNNSGATAPTTTFAHMWWYDTANNILKQRNETDDGWLNRFFDSGSTGQVGAQKNSIINGDFNVWQRGTSFATIADQTYTADRWEYEKSGAMVHTVSRSADFPTVAESDHLSNYCILVDCTTIDGTIAATDYCFITQHIEGYNIQNLAQKEITLSFWHKHTKTGTYCVAIQNSGADRSYVAEYTQAVSDTWEKASITISASPSAGTWDYTNGTGFKIIFAIAIGSNFYGTANTWESADDRSTSNQVNACDSVSNNFRLSQVQLEPGDTATSFETLKYVDELLRCFRYFWQINGTIIGNATSTSQVSGTAVRMPVEMRTTPTLLNGTYTVNAGLAGTVGTPWTITSTAYPVHNSASNWTVTAYVKLTAGFDAEL